MTRRRGKRVGRLLVAVRSMSGHTYEAGTLVELVGSGAAVDAWAGGEWVPLRWWEFAETEIGPQPAASPGGGAGRGGSGDTA